MDRPGLQALDDRMPSKLADEALLWRIDHTEPVGDHTVFRIERQHSKHLSSQRTKAFNVIRCPDWVTVLAVTGDNRAVFVRQYRPGVDRITLELPGGVIDPQEHPLAAAQRELREETGYVSNRWIPLGSVEPNPALQGNRCWAYLAAEAVESGSPSPDEDESLEVLTHPLSDVPQLITSGAITHSLVVSAFYLRQLHGDYD